MKRFLLTAFVFLLLSFGAFATVPNSAQQVKEKSESERFFQNLAKIKCDEINYAYISFSMIKQMFAEVAKNADMVEFSEMFSSIRSVRRFVTTGDEGYAKLKDALKIFLEGEEEVMGMELMALHREEGGLSVLYCGSGNILVVNECRNEDISLTFLTGLSYDTFKKMSSSGFDFNFGLDF